MATPIDESINLTKCGMLPEKRTAFFMCDMQENFREAVIWFDNVVEVAGKATKLAALMDIPLIVTEQYPKGLGNTAKEIDVSLAYGVFRKTMFSMVTPEVDLALKNVCEGNVECVVLFGIEAHVCVEQTAAVLRSKGLQVHILADACTSRGQEDRLLAFERMRQIGCFISTFESVMFKLLGNKNHPCFKQITSLISDTSPHTGLVNCFI